MVSTVLRAMQSSDVQAVAKLAEEAFKDSYPFDWTSNAEALLSGSESGKVFVGVAELNGAVVGYCNLRAWPAGGWIDQIAVSISHQRKGIGGRLLRYVLDEAIRRGFWKVCLIISEAEQGLLTFYRTCGFDREGLMKDQIKKGVNGILLSYITDYSLHPNR